MQTCRRSDKERGKKDFLHAIFADSICVVCLFICHGWTKVDAECLQGKGKVRNITRHCRYRVKYRNSSYSFSMSTLFWSGCSTPEPAVFPPRMKQSTLFSRRMDGLQVRFGRAWRRENSLQQPVSNPKTSIPQRVANPKTRVFLPCRIHT
jgi:hypothetical protein